MTVLTNKDYDSDFCGSLPLHLINHVQSYGFLLVINSDLNVVQYSENCTGFIGYRESEILNHPVKNIFSSESYEEFQEKVLKNGSDVRIPLKASLISKDRSCFKANMVIHFKEKYFLIEVEPDDEEKFRSFSDVYREFKYILSSLKKGKTLEQLTAIAAKEIRRFTGFDKVMIYRFDEKWNGFVLAEDKLDALESYLNLWFPASDVPKQARELYLNNPYRLIPDRDFVPSKLMPVVNPLINSFTDISGCNLKGVAPVHLEYLRNMDVKASMSVPIIIENNLWGLISCHHKTDRNLSYEFRAAFELLSEIISSQISGREKEQELVELVNLKDKLTAVLERLYSASNLPNALLEGEKNILDLFSLSGAAIIIEGVIIKKGNAPEEKQINNLVYWLQNEHIDKVWATANLSEMYYECLEYKEIACGILVIPISIREGSFILGFRPEVVQTVQWGGNPQERILIDKDGVNYHPRNSFSSWQETVKNISEGWSTREKEIAERLRVAILEKLVNI